MTEFFMNYFKILADKTIEISPERLKSTAILIESAVKKGGKVIIVGNGGSAAIASHAAIDLTKSSEIEAITFNESSLITCFANDFGYENWVQEAIKYYGKKNDIVVLISSSGSSKNIINGAVRAKELGLQTITFSGFSSTNNLRQIGDVNFWVDSTSYNVVETVHQNWILSIIDFLAEKKLKENFN